MSTIRIPVAMAASVVAVLTASTSFADDDDKTMQHQEDTTSTTTSTSSSTTQPPVTTTQTTVPQTTVPQTTVQPPIGTTTTTQAIPPPTPLMVSTDQYTEKTVERRPNTVLLSTGAGIFAATYGASVIAGAVSDRDADKKLFIPVVGPWLDLGNRECDVRSCGSNEDFAKAVIIASGIAQGAGVLLALSSLIIPESTTVEERTSAERAKALKPTAKVLPLSIGRGASAGLGVVGRF